MKARANVEKIRAWMILNGYNQSQLAQKIGVTPATIGRVLNETRSPSAKIMQGLVSLGMRVDDIFLPSSCQKDRT